jgi:uncharacterized protein (TIGR02246 family)
MSTASMMPTIETAVRSLAATFADAWNRHDARALANQFTEDGDLINPAGRVANGRREIEALFADEHSGNMQNSQMSQTLSGVRMLSPEVVVATHRCDVSAMRHPVTGELMTAHAIATFVLKNEGGTWRIAVARAMIPMPPPER